MLQYTGYRNLAGGREYAFALHAFEAPGRSFTVLIAAAAFRPGLLKYQDGPDLCYGKLQAALAGEELNGPVCSSQRVTESDIERYRAAGRAKVRKWTDEQRLAAKQRAKASRLSV
jgi:hypothetical protein